MSNAALKQQIDKLTKVKAQDQASIQRRKGKRLPFKDWVQKFITIKTGQPFSFDGNEYLLPIYEDPHPYEIFRKAAQVKISTKNFLEGFYYCDRYGAKILYYLAADGDAYDFSNDRIKPVIDDSNYLQQMMTDRAEGVDNVGMKHVGKGTIYIRGLWTKAKVKSVDADMLVLDELDEANQENKRFAYDRILASDLQIVRELSQPSIPEYGIDESFQKTDQRFWHMRCTACNHWTCLDLDHIEEQGRMLPRHILEIPDAMRGQFAEDQKFYRACAGCRAPLQVSQGEWVPQYPDRIERRGYHISQLIRQQPMVGHADPADWIMDSILGARKTSDKMRITISVLGYAYGGDRANLTNTVLDKAEGPHGYLSNAGEAYLGYDQGDELHIVVMKNHNDKPEVIHCEQTADWGRITQLVKQFKVSCVVGDALPNKKTAKDVNRACEALQVDDNNPQKRCKAYIQYFKGDTLTRGEEGEEEDAVNKVQVDRTESLDDTVGLIVAQEMYLPRMKLLDAAESRTNDDFRSQLRMLVKDIEEDSKGVKRWRYKTNVANHYGMALNSARIARELAPITSSVVVVSADIGP